MAFAIVALLIIADRAGWLLTDGNDDMRQYHGVQARVVDVIDGDTLVVDIPDPTQQSPTSIVRLWGLNCPELRHHDTPAEPWSSQAADAARSLAAGMIVTLDLEPSRTRGRYGRVLAHVVLADGMTLNERLLERGLGFRDERWAHDRLSDYARAEQIARREQLGVWSARADAG